MKKGIIVGTALVGIAGGFILAQGTLFSSAEVQIKASEAKKIALEAYDGKVVDFEFDQDDRVPHYDFDIKNGNEKAEVTVDAISGAVTIKEVEAAKNTVVEKVEDTAGAVKSDTQIAINNATNKVANSTGVVEKNSEKVNEPVKETSKAVQAQISKAEAINIAYTVAKGTVIKTELDTDDGRTTYEIELRDGNIEYDVEIDATTGKILTFEQDFEDDDY